MTTIPDEFDHKKEYHDQIKPHVEELKRLCQLYHMPMFVAVATANEDGKTDYEYEAVLAMARRRLSDERISKFMFSFHGFETKMPKEVVRAIAVLEHYLAREKQFPSADRKVVDDQIQTFVDIANGARVQIPSSVTNTELVIDDDSLISL